MTQAQTAPGTRKFFVASLLISATLVAPFIVLEWVNRRTFREDFPFVLFTLMSLHSLLIVVSLTPAIQRLRAERSLRALKLGHWVGLLLGAFLVYVYVNVVIDQLPCFPASSECRIATKAMPPNNRWQPTVRVMPAVTIVGQGVGPPSRRASKIASGENTMTIKDIKKIPSARIDPRRPTSGSTGQAFGQPVGQFVGRGTGC